MAGPIKCRSCDRIGLMEILSLGRLPLANALRTERQLAEVEETYPLNLLFCPHCTLVQIAETISPEKLFSEYLYYSSFSDTMLHHAEALVRLLIEKQGLSGGSLVIEIASNDGYLLQYYERSGIPVLGIEPAANLALQAQSNRGIPTICDFFSERLAQQLADEGREADVIHAHNVLAHVPDLNGFVRGLKLILKKTGVAVVEIPYVKDLIEQSAFDTIYHEHLCYFSLTALDVIFDRHGLVVCDVERLAIHGGSLRIYLNHRERGAAGRSSAVLLMLQQEKEHGLQDPMFYLRFGERVGALREHLPILINQLKERGARVAAYGASAKGSTLLNYFRIGPEMIEYVVDRSTIKQGRYTPGTRLPIFPPEKLLEDLPDYTLLLTWNIEDEILEQQAEYRRRGGKFIVPIPKPRII
jgi:SAM-dependent methyltransferase